MLVSFQVIEGSLYLPDFLTILLNGLSTNTSAIRVEVSRTPCTVLSASLMQIVCVLGAQRSFIQQTQMQQYLMNQ
jgi:hypothetical protein